MCRFLPVSDQWAAGDDLSGFSLHFLLTLGRKRQKREAINERSSRKNKSGWYEDRDIRHVKYTIKASTSSDCTH